ncbi:hypothetical protein AVEN_190729-1 [Araneus ventricosus]|uniref:Uncharacterized protein n=1 Tax=Araneus ventricosus TaxID=182803 RepID=A0A4Y2MQ94_ARAVE|nr:hypothetical protein AVEN_190729-1 [Araneus ventricosus]
MTSVLEIPPPNFLGRFNVHQAHIHGGSSVESGFESGTLRPPKSRPYFSVTVTLGRGLKGILDSLLSTTELSTKHTILWKWTRRSREENIPA